MEPLTTAHLTFFASLVLLGYSYVGYPVLLWLLGQLHGEETAVQADPAIWPDVSVVIAAHNEEVVIAMASKICWRWIIPLNVYRS